MIEEFGWSEMLGREFAPYAARGYVPGRVVAQHRGAYVVLTDHGDLSGQLSGRLIHDAAVGGHPVVGDWVAVAARQAEGAATVHAVLARSNERSGIVA